MSSVERRRVSMIVPSASDLSRACTNARKLPGVTCVACTQTYSLPSSVMAMFFRKSFAFKLILLQNKRSFQNPVFYPVPIVSIKSLLLIFSDMQNIAYNIFLQVSEKSGFCSGISRKFLISFALMEQKKNQFSTFAGVFT